MMTSLNCLAKRNSSSYSSQDFGTDHQEGNGAYGEDQSEGFFDARKEAMNEAGSNGSPLARPASFFRKKSPVPQLKSQPGYDDAEPELDAEIDPAESEQESELEPHSMYQDEDEGAVNEAASDMDNAANDEESEQDEIEHDGLSTLKRTELRALAKVSWSERELVD